MYKPEPIYFIPADAPARNQGSWHAPNSLCRTCVFQFLQEPYCDTVYKTGKIGVVQCDGYELETRVNKKSPAR
jgi:hypothetical protein